MSEIHLICNAHIDPVWQWEWEEGAATAVSTFRAAADFCEEFDDFVFCHNEALLYRWIEEYEPKLFKRIQALVKAGKWHIMGGWYLQPDCNMSSGESIIRQMQLGRAYFVEKFGYVNTTAINFDPFGHNRGLVQLMKKAGYDSYLFMRPNCNELSLPGDDFMWVGYDGSEIMAHRMNTGYNSPLGGAEQKVTDWLENHPDTMLGLIPWGVGNHGGGPSRKDIADLNALKARLPEKGLRHSTPEKYFASLAPMQDKLPKISISLNPFGVGCYTSQIRIKQQHRALEGLIDQTERMLSHAAMGGLIEYPSADLEEAARDLCMAEFHDILPGSSIQPVEDTSLRIISHAQEILTRLRARAFYALAAGQEKAAPGEYPILVYNPHPYPVDCDVEGEFMLADQNWDSTFTNVTVWQNGKQLPAQVEKEISNIALDWRKRVVFHTTLAPMQMNRFDCRTNLLPERSTAECAHTDVAYIFDNGPLHAEISRETGLLSRYQVDGHDYLSGEAMKLLVLQDICDSWGMTVCRFRDVIGEFRLMTPAESAHFAGVIADELPPVRVIEDGPVRTVIEASFIYQNSCAVLTYKLPKQGNAIQIGVRLLCADKDVMIKLSIPTACSERYLGQGMFGMEDLHMDGRECVSQQWTAAVGSGHALTLINDGVYGSDFCEGEIRTSLLRSVPYTAHPIGDRIVLRQDRFSPRIDQGERLYNFVLQGGETGERMLNVTREAQVVNEPAYALSFFPDGGEGVQAPAVILKGDGVQMSALRRAADGSGWILRVFETTGECERTAHLELPLFGVQAGVRLKPFEITTLRVDPKAGTIQLANLLD